MKVLIVDDETIVAKALARAFQLRGHECILAATGEEGLEKWEVNLPNVILLDVVMPGLTGPQVIREYKNRNPGGKLPCVILMTAHSGIKGKDAALESGAHDLVHKPFENIFSLVEEIEVKLKQHDGSKGR